MNVTFFFSLMSLYPEYFCIFECFFIQNKTPEDLAFGIFRHSVDDILAKYSNQTDSQHLTRNNAHHISPWKKKKVISTLKPFQLSRLRVVTILLTL